MPRLFSVAGAAWTLAALAVLAGAVAPAPVDRAAARKLMDDGNFKDAFEPLKALALAPGNDGETAADFQRAVQCLQNLNRTTEVDALREAVAAAHPQDWIVLSEIAQNFLDLDHQGVMIAGQFERGGHRGGGKAAHALQRDRVRALQLFRQALDVVEAKAGEPKRGEELVMRDRFTAALQSLGGNRQAWRLQTLTDLTKLPDYEDGWWYGNGNVQGAPVDEQDNPILYAEPASWRAAKNDGERWRWALAAKSQRFPEHADRELLARAEFLNDQFGVQTMAEYSWWFARSADGDQGDSAKSQLQIESLGVDETIAKLASGIKRFKLPDEQNPIRLYQRIVEHAPHDSDPYRSALVLLAQVFENRRQYPRAAEYWKLAVETTNVGAEERQSYVDRLAQITGPWGRLEPTVVQPHGKGATLEYRFRNGKRVEFVAQEINLKKLIDDLKAYLKDDPKQLDWNRVQLENLGYRLVVENQQQYVGEPTAKWTLDLEPRANHLDRRVTVTTPLQKGGAYLVTARIEGGNEHHVIVWIADTAIVKKPLAGAALYYVADAVTGKPLAKCHVELFGYRQEAVENQPNRYRVITKNFAEFTDEGGMVKLPVDDVNRQFAWLAIASSSASKKSDDASDKAKISDERNRLAVLGFSGVWNGEYAEQQYEQVKVFPLTDRPVYRPGQTVEFKFWVANAKYDQPEESSFAGQSFNVEIHDPQGNKLYEKSLVADSYGGLVGSWKLPADAPLGQYQTVVVNHGGGSFRVEEYKKPEFEVTIDAPEKPVKLGDKITATIKAKYYFGSPVTEAQVKYKVLRTPHDARWYPTTPWDWLYGNGYWWFAEDYGWYPGFARWGCLRPWPWWFWRQPVQPELVAEREAKIGPDGTLQVEIDTAPALAMHGDEDHAYQIQVEVVDQSRRTITASGQVLAPRRPFGVYLWTHRGYYHAGDTIEVNAAARTIDGKPVQGKGVLRLLQISYDGEKPVEKEAARWDLATNDEGLAEIQIKASEAGQYRLSYEVTSENGEGKDKSSTTIEGGQVLVVRGDDFNGADFQFNDVEIIPDKRDYAPGDKVKLEINVNRAGAAVLLFLRPSNGIYQPPQLVQLDGKSTVVEVDVATKDMPNFFVEAVTVHGAKVHTAVREIFVPPTQRVVDVEVEPSAKEYLPGEKARIDFTLTGIDGKPTVGSTVVAIYDKALDYIAGGGGSQDIREFFWKWRRSHQPQSESNLLRTENPQAKRDTKQMENLGVFGESGAESDQSNVNGTARLEGAGMGRDRRLSLLRSGGVGGGGMMQSSGLGDALGMPASAAAPMREIDSLAMDKSSFFSENKSSSASPAGAAPVAPTVRQNFADTALWVGALETDANGRGHVELDMPENLTAWKIGVWGMGRGTRVGQGAAEVVTRKNIIVRLQAPRFFVEKDEVVLSAVVHNYLKEDKQVEVKLELFGDVLAGLGQEKMSETVEIAAGKERRVDWRVKATGQGEARVRMSALTDVESDAMEQKFPVFVHGMLKTESFSGAIRPPQTAGSFSFVVPHERKPEQTRLEVRYSPTLAGAMVDALPYLIDYPYGCTEQTLNRFLPAVITQRTLKKMGVDLAAIQQKRTNMNAQEIGDDAERAKQWKRFDRNPVFDEAEMATIVKASVNRLTDMQLSDGGWGWFSGWGEYSSPHTTATVVRGLLVAQQNEVALVPGVLERGIEWLMRYQQEQLAALDNWDRQRQHARVDDQPAKSVSDNLDAYVQLVLVQATGAGHPRMRAYLYADRTQFAVYSLATFGLALQHETAAKTAAPPAEMLPMIMKNISQYVRQDDENQTAWLDLPGNQWWYWYGSEYEAHAYYLKLLSATEPKSEVAPRMVKYLLNNRKHATSWNSTRDTALVVEAFADYLAASGEAKVQLTVEVLLDGKVEKTVAIAPESLFTFDNKLVIEGAALADGKHTVELRKQGEGALYFNGYLTNFTLEDPIHAAGLEVKVERRYFKLTPLDKKAAVAGARGQAIEQAVEKYERNSIVDLQELKSGDLVEVELIVESKNDYEYILFEDMKPAGCEPVEVRSGYNGNELGAYVEYRDERVALFARTLARGRHSVSYRLRAEIPGKFSALPTKASAMYAPELKANSEEFKMRIED